MTTSDFARLEALFHELETLDPTARRARLDALSLTAPSLCAQLERLLARDPDADLLAGLLDGPALPRPGDRIGYFLLVRRLGEGGMGVVFEAQQERPVERRVALKLVHPELLGARARARFALEQQTLAAMQHPGIAQIFEAGATEHGHPWVSMELVEGTPISRYCDDRRLGVRARVALLADVCRAVQHAHQKGVLHRDLKPTNILVAEVDGQPRPRIIDFGLAKELDGDQDATLSRHGDVVGTVEYMSPEQTLGEAVDTRSDLYSLGVVAHQLLTGSLPIPPPPSGSVRDFEATLSRIRDDPPSRPSTASLVAPDAALRGTDVSGLRRQLRGDLDWILLRCLAKEPDRRYSSAAALAADFEAHLADQPIAASPPSRTYRIGKFARRHRVAVAAASVVLLALVTTAVTSSVLYLRAESARRAAERERRSAEAVSAFLQQTLASADPAEVQDRRAMTVLAVLDEASWRLQGELAEQPAVAARLELTIGRAYQNLGKLDDARDHLERALDRVPEEDPPDLRIDALLALAEVQLAADDAASAEQAAVAARDLAVGDRGGRLVESLRVLGEIAVRRGDASAAEGLLRRSLEEASAGGVEGGAKASSQRALGLLLADQGRLDEAVELLDSAVATRQIELGRGHSEVAEALNDLAWVLSSTAQTPRALELMRESLGILERVYPEDHPKVAVARAGYGGALREAGRHEAAIEQIEAALESFRRRLGDQHAYVAYTVNNLALACEQQGDLQRAAALYTDALTRHRTLFGDDSPVVATILSNRARARRAAGDPQAAERDCEESLRIRRASLRPDHPDIARNLHLLARLRVDDGDSRAAAAYLEEALEIRQAGLPADHPLLASTLFELGEVEATLGRAEASCRHLRQAQVIYRTLAAANPAVHAANLQRLDRALETRDGC